MKMFYARICWNELGWTKPDASSWRHESKDTFIGKNGFGHEEWLFKSHHKINGFQYGFIEGFNQTQKLAKGERANIILYTIGPRIGSRRRPRYLVGTLLECERLTDNLAAKAVLHFQNAGWLDQMAADVKAAIAGLPVSRRKVIQKFIERPEHPTHLINLRYRWSDTIHPGRCDLAPQDHPIQDRDYYHFLYEANEALSSNSMVYYGTRASPGGTKQPLNIPPEKFRKKPSSPVFSGEFPQSQHLHIRMQNKLLESWQREFGDCVWLEDHYVDVVVRGEDRLIYCEVKARRPASQAIREALGQVLEYAFYDQGEDDPIPELHIAGLSELTDADRKFLMRIKNLYGLDITYHHVNLDNETEIGY